MSMCSRPPHPIQADLFPSIRRVMGNKITYHSPSRGTSMEMGAAITVLVFSQFSLPVSTSMCITGATVGVGLCNGTFRAINFQRVGLLFISWVMTIPSEFQLKSDNGIDFLRTSLQSRAPSRAFSWVSS